MNRVSSLTLAATLLLLASVAHAEPYEIVARFIALDGKAPSIEMRVEEGDVLPRATADYALEGIFLRGKTDDVSKSSLAITRNFTLLLECRSVRCRQAASNVPVAIGSVQVVDGKIEDTLLAKPEDLVSGDHADELTFRVRAKYTRDFLCAQEQILRNRVSAQDPQWQESVYPFVTNLPPLPAPPSMLIDASKVEPSSLEALAFFWKMGRLAPKERNDKPNLYSFCSKFADAIDWKKVAKSEKVQVAGQPAVDATSAEADAVKERQKHELSEAVARDIGERLHVENVEIARDRDGLPENVFVAASHSFSIVKELGAQLSFLEVEGAGERAMEGVVDVDSKLRLVADKEFCEEAAATCGKFFKKYLSVSLSGKDGSESVSKAIELAPLGGLKWSVAADLSKFLGQTVLLTVKYTNDDITLDVVRKDVRIEDVGFITTFPVASEVAALVGRADKGSDDKELELKSSIPLSWAYNLTASDGRHVAITLPWMMGISSREFPDLADYVKVFPHVSLILPVSSDAETAEASAQGDAELALGLGIALANAFTFSWGFALNTEANYLLLGISAPDLVKIFNPKDEVDN